jgi:hypothetical protein
VDAIQRGVLENTFIPLGILDESVRSPLPDVAVRLPISRNHSAVVPSHPNKPFWVPKLRTNDAINYFRRNAEVEQIRNALSIEASSEEVGMNEVAGPIFAC